MDFSALPFPSYVASPRMRTGFADDDMRATTSGVYPHSHTDAEVSQVGLCLRAVFFPLYNCGDVLLEFELRFVFVWEVWHVIVSHTEMKFNVSLSSSHDDNNTKTSEESQLSLTRVRVRCRKTRSPETNAFWGEGMWGDCWSVARRTRRHVWLLFQNSGDMG